LKIERTDIPGIVVIEPQVFTDDRGSFFETFQAARYADAGIPERFPQDNRSVSRKGVLRAFHYQIEHPQGHLVTLTHGTIYDVGVDLRPGSPTFGRWYATTLTADPPRQIFHPPGVAHGFCVLSDSADIWYKCSDLYHAGDEGGLLWSDPDLGIPWPLHNPVIHPRDAAFPRLRDIPKDRLPHAAF
jgi:dTDP-4-dehydrorhamnose 3,5-epimerase